MAYIGNSPINGAFQKIDSIAAGFNGVTVAFLLTVGGTPVTPGTPQNLIVSRGGVLQEPTIDYTVSGTYITLLPTPVSGETCFIVRLGDVGTLNTVTDGAVTLPKVDANVLSALNHTVTPTGTITSTNVQAALAELDTDITALKNPGGIIFLATNFGAL